MPVIAISERQQLVLSEIERVFKRLRPEATDVRVEYNNRTIVGTPTGRTWMARFYIYSSGRVAGKFHMFDGYYSKLLITDQEIKISEKGFDLFKINS